MKNKHVIALLLLLITVATATHRFYAADTALTPTWESKLLAGDTTCPVSPASEAEFRAAMEYAAAHQLSKVTFNYPTSSFNLTYIDYANQAHAQCYYGLPEYFGYRGTQVAYIYAAKHNTVELTLKFEYTDEAKSLEDNGRKAAESVLETLYTNGALTRDMTERDRAFALMEWLSEHTSYSTTCPWSGTAWSALVMGQAACGGYTAAYDLLLKLDGIQCHGQFGWANGTYHLWTVAILDGVETYIDATWYDAILDLTPTPELYSDIFFTQDSTQFHVHHIDY